MKGSDLGQLIRNSYDPVRKALRVSIGDGSVAAGKKPDAAQAVGRAAITAEDSIKVLDTGAPSGNSGTRLDWQQVLKSVFDLTTGKMRGTL